MTRPLLVSLAVGLFGLSLVAAPVRAGKPERDRAKELERLMKAAQGAIKKSCGCGPSLAGKWRTFPDVHKMFRCHDTVDAIKDASLKHCADAKSKQAYCKNVSRFEIAFTTERYNQPKQSGKTIQTWCTDMKYTNADELKAILDKF
jgi:hypothetical protein